MASFFLSGSVDINWELSPGEKLTDERVWAVTDEANFLACMLTTPTVRVCVLNFEIMTCLMVLARNSYKSVDYS